MMLRDNSWRTDYEVKGWRHLYPADVAPREHVKSRYACRHPECENGPSTGHEIRDGFCEEHREREG